MAAWLEAIHVKTILGFILTEVKCLKIQVNRILINFFQLAMTA
jgi:hypothetical protein